MSIKISDAVPLHVLEKERVNVLCGEETTLTSCSVEE
jgi:hypothetical protein